jgi:regulator of replication initiation timing
MVQKGFNETAKKADMDLRFNSMENRLGRLEKDVEAVKITLKNMVVENYGKRIEKLEDELKEVKGTLALILK